MDTKHPILLAEDDENDVFIFRRAVAKAGILTPLQVVHDGEQVVNYLSRKGEFADKVRFPVPRFLITDLKMPRMGGLDLLRWLKANPEKATIPIMVLTSSKQERDIVEAYQLGANSYVVKPASSAEWVEMMQATFGYWGRWAELPQVPDW